MSAQHTPGPWFVGGNGNWFMDAAGYRYCVTHESVGRGHDGRTRYRFGAYRNGQQMHVSLHADADAAKAQCERDAAIAKAEGHS